MLAFTSEPPLPLQQEQISSKHHIKPLCGLGTYKPFLVVLLAPRSWQLIGNPRGETVMYVGTCSALPPELARCCIPRCCLLAKQRRVLAQAQQSAVAEILHAQWNLPCIQPAQREGRPQIRPA